MKATLVRLFSAALLLMAPSLTAQSMPVSEAGVAEPELAGFGQAVAAVDGAVFVGEGANTMRPGLVYVYGRSGGDWVEVEQLRAPDAETGDGFGTALVATPSELFVAQTPAGEAGEVHVFRSSGDGWRHAGSLAIEELAEGAGFGASLSTSGPLLAIGAPGVNEAVGRVYLFERTTNGWIEAGRIEAPEAVRASGFGAAIALDGTRLLVGAPGRSQGTGAAFVFRQDPGTGEWRLESELSARGLERGHAFGSSVDLFGGRALVAAPGYENRAGAVLEFTFEPAAEAWSAGARLRPFDGSWRTGFGSAVVYDGDAAYIGAPGSGSTGAIYAVRRTGESWSGVEKIVPAQVGDGAGFGATLALAGDVAVSGAVGVDFDAGAAVILDVREQSWAGVGLVKSEDESLPALTGGEVRCEEGMVAETFRCTDVDLLSFLPVKDIGGPRGVELNDIWGWADPASGREFALVGRMDGTSFVEVTDPFNPRYLGDLPMTEGAIANSWRDIKVYQNHAYIVADGAGDHGMQIFDLTRLLNIEDPVTFDADAHYDGLASTHNIVIDTASGFAFGVGASGGGQTCGGGLHMIDIRNPTSPEFAGCFADPQTGRSSTGYSHDAQCVTYSGPDEEFQGREICLGANETALSIADVTDKDNPVALARATYPNVGYTHQGWLTPDQRYFYMNDELDELQGKTEYTRTLIWDVSELDDPILVGEFMGTTRATDHNLYIRGNTMYQSNYEAGLRVVDISDPESPVEIGYFDTVPTGENTPGFGGSWSNYPYFPSGTIIVSSERQGLFVLKKREPIS